LLDHDLAAQLAAIAVGDEADQPVIRVVARRKQVRRARIVLQPKRARGQPFGDPALADQRRAADEQRMPQTSRIQRSGGALKRALLPGR